MGKIITFTGSREGVRWDQVKRGLRELRNQRYVIDVMIFGGARGADTMALIAASCLFPEVHKLVIVPKTIGDQPKAARRAIIKYADEIIEMKHPAFPQARAYYARDDEMVRRATHVIAFYGYKRCPNIYVGGTGHAVLNAKTRDIKVKCYFNDRNKPPPRKAWGKNDPKNS